MFLLVHIGMFTYHSQSESKVIGLFNERHELDNILEQFRQKYVKQVREAEEDDEFECKMVQTTMTHKELFEDYYIDKWVVYEINPSNGSFYNINGLEPYQIYVTQLPYYHF